MTQRTWDLHLLRHNVHNQLSLFTDVVTCYCYANIVVVEMEALVNKTNLSNAISRISFSGAYCVIWLLVEDATVVLSYNNNNLAEPLKYN